MSMAIKAARFEGDPGLFGFIGKGLKKATGIVGDLGVPGVSGAARLANRALTARLGNPVHRAAAPITQAPANFRMPPSRATRGGRNFNPPFGGGRGVGITLRSGRRIGFGETNGTGTRTQKQQAKANAAALECPVGFRPNKTSYHTLSEGFVEAGTKCVRIRKRNPLNPRAADRAIRRIVSAKKAVKSLSKITVRKSCD